MLTKFFKKYYNKYIGYGITIAFFVIPFIWDDGNVYFYTILLTVYLIAMINGLYEKIQYVEGARTHRIHFSTANDRLYDLPEFLTPLFYLGIFALVLYMDGNFFGPFGVYYLIGYALISIWSSFYGKLPSASMVLDKEDNELSCYDGVETYEVSLDEIQNIKLSKKKIIIEIPTKKINLIHLSLDEKEMRSVSNYFRNQLRIAPTIILEEETTVSQ